ncbi:MAG TPA: selenocysteine-specific translation elongation factor, partial [Gemmatimonadales bacterium]
MIIGTAGHIDHGKSTLVAALTGRSMDRLAEERRRGITIELNFAPLELEGLAPIGIVDVPGHEDFVRTMVAGATGIDLVLLVVDAVEGIRPQTLEHLAIVEQLGIPRGIPVITKIDLAEPDWVDLVAGDLVDRLEQSSVDFRPPIRVSPVTGEGMDALRDKLRSAATSALAIGHSALSDLFRLPIDRAFAIAGTGPVVTGTLWSGSVRVGDQVRIEPGSLRARVRSVESFGRAVDAAVPGSRTAVGLSGVEVGALRRGQVLLGTGEWQPTTVFDASIALLGGAPRPLITRARVRVHHGTAEAIARVYPRQPIEPGRSGPARVVPETPLVVRGGDRFVIRSYSPVTTIGGGWIADPEPPRKAPWPEDLTAHQPAARLRALLTRRPAGVEVEAIARLLGAGASAVVSSTPGVTRTLGRLLLQQRVEDARQTVLTDLAEFHRRDPVATGKSLETLRSGLGTLSWLTDNLLRELVLEEKVRVVAGRAALAGHQPASAGGEGEVDQVVAAVRAAGLEGPTRSELAGLLHLKDLPGAIRMAVGRGLIESVERDRYVSLEAVGKLEEVLR